MERIVEQGKNIPWNQKNDGIFLAIHLFFKLKIDKLIFYSFYLIINCR